MAHPILGLVNLLSKFPEFLSKVNSSQLLKNLLRLKATSAITVSEVGVWLCRYGFVSVQRVQLHSLKLKLKALEGKFPLTISNGGDHIGLSENEVSPSPNVGRNFRPTQAEVRDSSKVGLNKETNTSV